MIKKYCKTCKFYPRGVWGILSKNQCFPDMPNKQESSERYNEYAKVRIKIPEIKSQGWLDRDNINRDGDCEYYQLK